MSRPHLPIETRRAARVHVPVTEQEKALWTKAAALVNGPGRPLTEYVRECVKRQAERDIRRKSTAGTSESPNAEG